MDADDWDRRYAATPVVWDMGPNQTITAEVTALDLPPGRALDLGAGEGRHAVWLADRGWDVIAVDFSSVGLEKGRRLAREHGVAVDWRCRDVTTDALPDGPFDLVVVAYLQLPAPVLTPVLGRVAQALAPGGTLLLVGHDRANLTEGVGGPSDEAVLHTAAGVVAALGGLTVQEATTVLRPVAVDGEQRHAVDTLVRARRGE